MKLPGRKLPWLLAAALTLSAALVILATLAINPPPWWGHHSAAPTASPYRPAITEQPLFAALRPATAMEAKQGNNALWELRYDNHVEGTDDTYVATHDFNTVYTPHTMIILVRPGVKWLGGPLGQIRLVFQDLRYEVPQTSWTNITAAEFYGYQKQSREFIWANVVYDPFCRLYSYGHATLAACQATPTQRLAVSDNPLLALSDKAGRKYVETNDADLVSGRSVKYLWYGTTSSTVKLHIAQPFRPADSDKHYYQKVVALQPGQQITGGSFAGLTVLLPTTYKRYYNDVQFDLYHVGIEDPIPSLCNTRFGGIKPYLGPDVLKAYTQYCQD